MTLVQQKESILIIGAGMGGLALAQGLLKAGFRVTVFERDQTSKSRSQGYQISILSMGMAALTALLSPEKMDRLLLAKVMYVADGFICANEKMEPLLILSQREDRFTDFFRSELRNLLQEGVPIEWNRRFVRFEEKDSRIIAYFEDGSSATGDFLIGCDGVASTVRELLPSVYGCRLGSIPKVIEYNRALMAGHIDHTPEWEILLPLNIIGPVRYRGPDSYSIGVVTSVRENRSPAIYWTISEQIHDRNAPWYRFDQGLDSRREILDHCKRVIKNGSWHDSLKKLVLNTEAEDILTSWVLRTTQFPATCHYPMVPSGRVTLLGDAAHTMPPDSTLGVSNVFEDARLLTALLTSSPKRVHWPTLTAEFEREMFARAKKAVQESENAVGFCRHTLNPPF